MAIATRAKPARVRACSKIVLQRIHLLFLGLAGMNDFLYRAATGGLDSLRCRFIQSTSLLDQFLFRLLINNSHSGTTCHRIHVFNRPLKISAHDFPYLILHWSGKISRDNFLLLYNNLAQWRKTRLGNVKASNAQGNPNNCATPENPCNCRTKRYPKTGEDNPNQIQKSCPYSGCRRRDEFLPKWAEGESGNPETRDPKRNADDRATPKQPN